MIEQTAIFRPFFATMALIFTVRSYMYIRRVSFTPATQSVPRASLTGVR